MRERGGAFVPAVCSCAFLFVPVSGCACEVVLGIPGLHRDNRALCTLWLVVNVPCHLVCARGVPELLLTHPEGRDIDVPLEDMLYIRDKLCGAEDARRKGTYTDQSRQLDGGYLS